MRAAALRLRVLAAEAGRDRMTVLRHFFYPHGSLLNGISSSIEELFELCKFVRVFCEEA